MSTLKHSIVQIAQAIPLAQMSVAQIAALPQAQLQEAHISLQSLHTTLKAVLERMHSVLETRYAGPAKQARLADGRDFGICHLTDGALQITVELPKNVKWDQKLLTAMAERIAAAGDKVADYIDIDYSVAETRFNNWPPVLKEQFRAARTVSGGKAKYRLALLDSKGGR